MKILIVYLEKERKEAYELKRKIRNHEIKIINRKRLKRFLEGGFIKFDLTIVVGGDGTFLRTAQFISNKLILGINPKPGRREAFLSSMTADQFSEELLSKLKVEYLPRLKVKINNKLIKEKAVNDIYIGDKKPYKTSKYIIEFKGKKETQISSGVIASTAIGTNSWFKSLTGKTHTDNSKIYFAVREPYSNKVYKATIKEGATQKLKLTALKNLILVVDSVSEEYKVNKDDRVTITIEKSSLKRLVMT